MAESDAAKTSGAGKLAGAALEAAMARWNARANGAYLGLADLAGAVQDDLEGLLALLADRQRVAPILRAGAGGADLGVLADGLASLHIEVQTLQAQVRRAIGAAEAQAGQVEALISSGSVHSGEAAPREIAVMPRTPREGQLAAQVDALREELAQVKEQLSEARARLAQRGGPAPADALSHEAQTEIARLRARVLELMAREPHPVPRTIGDLSLQYERIMAMAHDAEGRRRRMGELLVAAGVISNDQLDAALREQQTAWNRHLGSVLVDLGFVSEDTVAQALAAQINVPYVRLIHEPPRPEALALLSRALAHHHTCVPLRFEREVLVVAMANPMDLVAIDDIELATRRTIKPVVASAAEIKAALKQHYR